MSIAADPPHNPALRFADEIPSPTAHMRPQSVTAATPIASGVVKPSRNLVTEMIEARERFEEKLVRLAEIEGKST